MKWKCTVCDYIHVGESPPDVCPVCGVDSSFFEKVEDKPAELGRTAPAVERSKPASAAETLTHKEAMTKAIRSISYGLFVITSSHEGRDNGQTANTCFQITSDPVQIAIGINKNNYTHELISQNGRFGISILDQDGVELARRFGYRSGREFDKFEGIKAHRGSSGVLLLDEVLGTLEAEVAGTLDAGTHTLFLGKVTAGEYLRKGEPMTYDYFRSKK